MKIRLNEGSSVIIRLWRSLLCISQAIEAPELRCIVGAVPFHVGEWLSLVEHLVRDQGVGGSNPLSPTNFFNNLNAFLVFPSHRCRRFCRRYCLLRFSV